MSIKNFLFQYRFLNFPYKKLRRIQVIRPKNMQKNEAIFSGYVRQE